MELNINEYLSVTEALKRMLESTVPLEMESVGLLESLHRILYEDVVSTVNIPPCDNSAMDGFAIRSVDCVSATPQVPVLLSIADEIKAGDDYRSPLDDRSAVRIMTGAPLPPRCDAVVPVEDTQEIDGRIVLHHPIPSNANIRHAGEDIGILQKILTKGDIIKSADVGLLASLNYSEVPVYRQPRVAIISTGNEIAEVGEPMSRGMIRNSNAYTLYCEVKRYNALPYNLGIARDNPGDIKIKLEEALQYDIILTTGGVSMGKYDFVKDSLEKLQVDLRTIKIRMKPGKPLIFGVRGKTLFFGLPGNPVSAMISFILYVRPVILKMMGSTALQKPIIKAVTKEAIICKPDRTYFFRGSYVINDNGIVVSLTGPQGSGILSSMSEANCLIIIPEGTGEVEPGEQISIMLIDHGEI